jgi:hypothetical protein
VQGPVAGSTGTDDALRAPGSGDLKRGLIGAVDDVIAGIVLMFAWQRVAPEFFLEETHERDTPVFVVEEG